MASIVPTALAIHIYRTKSFKVSLPQVVLETAKLCDSFVFSSWSRQTGTSVELDFLIVSLQHRSFLQIEVKSALDQSAIISAFKQLDKGKNLLGPIGPFQPGQKWNHVGLIYYKEAMVPLDACQNCQSFLLSRDTNLADWWRDLSAHLLSLAPDPGLDDGGSTTYLNILKYLLFVRFLQDNCITRG